MFKRFISAGLLVAVAVVAMPNQSQAASAFSVSKSSFDFYYTIGGAPPTYQSAEFTNNTGSTIYYRISVPNQPSWLNAAYTTEMDLPASPGTPNGIGAAVSVDHLAAGSYKTAIYINGQFSGAPLIFPITLTVLPAGSSQPSDQVRPEGTNVVGPDGTVYRISYGARLPYTSAGAFLSYGFNSWVDVKTANAAEMALPVPTTTKRESTEQIPAFITPRDGSLINDHGTVYIISDGYRQGFASAGVFSGLGYSFANVLPGDTSFLATLSPLNTDQMAHPPGTIVNDQGTICVMYSPFKGGGRRCFSSLTDMNTWGIRNSDMVVANSFDRNISISGVVQARDAYSPMNP